MRRKRARAQLARWLARQMNFKQASKRASDYRSGTGKSWRCTLVVCTCKCACVRASARMWRPSLNRVWIENWDSHTHTHTSARANARAKLRSHTDEKARVSFQSERMNEWMNCENVWHLRAGKQTIVFGVCVCSFRVLLNWNFLFRAGKDEMEMKTIEIFLLFFAWVWENKFRARAGKLKKS